MNFELKYNKEKISFRLKERNYIGTVKANKAAFNSIDESAVEEALINPIGSQRLYKIVKPKEQIVIVTSDLTRPMPSHIVLPLILRELAKAGVNNEDISIVFALGSHRPHSTEEKRFLVGETVYNSSIKILDSDINQCLRLGFCNNGTPVDIFKPVAAADRIICIGNIEYHYFAGYSGGAKAIMPGVSSRDAIRANHSNMLKYGAFAGNLESNPVRQDIDQVASFIKIDFILNVILDEKKHIIKAFAGDVIKAHREGCRFLDRLYKVKIDEKADIVVISSGGFPKDINLYQSQKALDNAKHAVKDKGIIIWCASASEGFGEKTFEEWMTTMSAEDMENRIKKNFVLGGHKAAAIAMTMKKADIYIVSDFDNDLLNKIGFVPFACVQEALDHALERLGPEAKVLVMPQADSTLPIL